MSCKLPTGVLNIVRDELKSKDMVYFQGTSLIFKNKDITPQCPNCDVSLVMKDQTGICENCKCLEWTVIEL